jgi:hypothetical protein
MIDHRASPGVSDEDMIKAGFPPGAGRGLFESPFFTCNHCQSCVVMGPLRTRPPNICTGCSRYICDGCEYQRKKLGMPCKTFDEIADEICEKAIANEKIKEI